MADNARRSKRSRRVSSLPQRVTAFITAWLMVFLPAIAQAVPARSLVTTAQIVEAMQNHQLPTDGVHIQLSIPITSAVSHPSLNIQAISPINRHDVRLRVACQDASQCLPFFAIATYPEAIGPVTFQPKLDPPSGPTSRSIPTTAAIPERPAPSTFNKPLDQSAPPVLHSGSIATLDFDEEHIHVRVEVVCLESGAMGDKIHVTTRDHKQIYVAEIVAPNALKGALTR